VTLLTNLVLHSPGIWGPEMGHYMHLQGTRLTVSLANAATNLLLLACWTVFLLRGAAGRTAVADGAVPGLVSRPAGGTA
jgi:hypothetical protein